MQIRISTTSPDNLNHDLLVLGIFSDERPPRGYTGRVDWRLNGQISREMAAGRVVGTCREKTLLAFPTRLTVGHILLIGLGPLPEIHYRRLREAGMEISRVVWGLRVQNAALRLPALTRSGLNPAVMTEAVLDGYLEYLSGERLRKATGLLDLLTPETLATEALLGLRQAQQTLKDPHPFEILAPLSLSGTG